MVARPAAPGLALCLGLILPAAPSAFAEAWTVTAGGKTHTIAWDRCEYGPLRIDLVASTLDPPPPGSPPGTAPTTPKPAASSRSRRPRTARPTSP